MVDVIDLSPFDTPDEWRNTVYRCINAKGRVLYVGCTSGFIVRLGQLKRKVPWWPDVVRVEVSRHAPPSITPTCSWVGMGAAHDVEIELIRTLRPEHNKNHNPDWVWDGCRFCWHPVMREAVA